MSFFARLIEGNEPPFVWSWRIIGSILFLVLLYHLAQACLDFSNGETILTRDFNQVYLMASAWRQGLDPYTPIPELSERFLGGSVPTSNPHPSPYPPPVVILASFLTLLPIHLASLAWFALCFLAGLASFLMLGQSFGVRPSRSLIAFFAVALSHAGYSDLYFGQFGFMQLFFIVLAWIASQQRRDMLSGIFLAIPLLVKFFGWPLLLFYAFSRRWHSLLAALGVLVVAWVIAACILGSGIIERYLFIVGPTVSHCWEVTPWNSSVFTLFERLVQPMTAVYLDSRLQTELSCGTERSFLAIICGFLLFCALLAVIWHRFIVRKDQACLFLALATISTVAAPVTWLHYTVLLAIPLFWIMGRWHEVEPSAARILAVVYISLVLFIDFSSPTRMWFKLLVPPAHPEEIPVFLILISTVPTLLIVALVIVRIRSDRVDVSQKSS